MASRTGSALLIAVTCTTLLGGCASEYVAESTKLPINSESTTETTAVVAEECRPPVEPLLDTEKQLHPILAEMELPEGTCYFSVITSDPVTEHDLSVMVCLRAPTSTSPNDLRPVATDIAHTLKKSEFGSRIASLNINNWGIDQPNRDEYLIDENFKDNAWDGAPSRQAELDRWAIEPSS